MKRNSILKGAFLLIICNLIGKVLGAIYKIPLASIVGSKGMGEYQLVFPIYCLILTLSSSGMPVAISKIVSELKAEGKHRDCKTLLAISAAALSALSLLGALIIIFIAKPVASFQGNYGAHLCYYALAPAVLFVGLLSAFRGYFQGNLLMFPTAISSLIEQTTKVLFGLFLAKRMIVYGVEMAVLGALIGVSVSEFFACIFLATLYFLQRKKSNSYEVERAYSKGQLFKRLVSFSMPITLGGLVLPVTTIIDSFLVVNLLMFMGYSSASATSLFGVQAGIVEPLINLPIVVAVSISTAILPNLSAVSARGDRQKLSSLIEQALRLTLSISLCSAACFVIFGRQLLALVFGRSLTSTELNVAVKLLLLSSLNVIFISLVQVLSSSLQAIGRPKEAVKSLILGCCLKVVMETALLLVPKVGILAVVISAGLCYFVVLCKNYSSLQKYCKVKLFSGYYYTSIQLFFVCMFAFFLNFMFINLFGEMLALVLAGTVTLMVFCITYYAFFVSKSNESETTELQFK